MKSKTIVTAVLLAFVAISVGFAVYKEVRKAPAPENAAAAGERADAGATDDETDNQDQPVAAAAPDQSDPVAAAGANPGGQNSGRVSEDPSKGLEARVKAASEKAGDKKAEAQEPQKKPVGESAKPATAASAPRAEPAPAPAAAPKQPAKPVRKVIAYYFKTTYGCASCAYVENFTREALQSGFPDELKDGTLTYQVVNVDFPENKHFIQDYQLSYKSVVLVEFEGEKQTRWKNLDAVWRLLRNKPEFIKYVQDETGAYLGGR